MTGGSSDSDASEEAPRCWKVPANKKKTSVAVAKCDVCQGELAIKTAHSWGFGDNCWRGFRSLKGLFQPKDRDILMRQMRDEAHAFRNDVMILSPLGASKDKANLRSQIKRRFQDPPE